MFNLARHRWGSRFPALGRDGSSEFHFCQPQRYDFRLEPRSTGGLANAVIAVRTPGAVYTGLALGTMGSAMDLYAADSTPPPDGGIKVFNTSFSPVTLGSDAFAVPLVASLALG